MCEPTTIGLAISAVGTLAKADAQAKAGAAAKAADFNAASLAEQAAADAVRKGQFRDLQLALRGSQVVAEQRVAQSGSGVDVNTGGALQTQRGTEAVNELDRQEARRNGALAAYGLRMRAQVLRQEGEYGEAAGKSDAEGTFLSGAGQVGLGAGKLFSQRNPGSEDFIGDGSFGGRSFADEAD